jgi:hypothetical protein
MTFGGEQDHELDQIPSSAILGEDALRRPEQMKP